MTLVTSTGTMASAVRQLGRRFGRGPRLPDDFSAQDREIVRAVSPYTMTSPERIIGLVRSVEYVVRRNLPGAIVECGVWRGGSMLAVAKTLLRLGVTNRDLFLFDTFEGMTEPTDHDVSLTGEAAADALRSGRPDDLVHANAPLDRVRETIRSSGYDPQHVHFVKGMVEDTLPGSAPDRIALLRLDTDWYESTRHELMHLYPRLARGGVLIIDDYGHWQGARKAVDEYFAKSDAPLLLNRLDYTGRVAIKC